MCKTKCSPGDLARNNEVVGLAVRHLGLRPSLAMMEQAVFQFWTLVLPRCQDICSHLAFDFVCFLPIYFILSGHMWICKARGTKCNLDWSRNWSTCFQGWQRDLAVLHVCEDTFCIKATNLLNKETSHTPSRRDSTNLPLGRYDLPWFGTHFFMHI